ncbi:MAG: NADH-quinone oxidoreductase subunit G [Legionellales bacterium]|nr:NADH-quinone oxidoreductase subunit G [Legionellales bacterium]
MIEVEIDGKKFQVEPGKMIIEVADQIDSGIGEIPRFCYHKKLSIAANCRMCLVDVEKSGKPLPACATPVTDGMIVRTRSQKAREAQKAVMEFLLINHPLDCPICDQGGECELQDVAMGYGQDISRYNEGKRSVKDKNLGSLVATEMTRCIHCTRCVRFGDEIAGMQELGTIGRGESTEIGTCVERSLVSELSGNIIDLCPVGALTSKPFRFSARAWEMEQAPSIAPHDCVGSNLNLHTLRQKVMRVVPRENESINETWLSDRDRFSYEALSSDERLLQPMIKENDEWLVTDWPTALTLVAEKLGKIAQEQGANKIGALLSPSSTIEEIYLSQKMLRKLGSNNIDHRLQQIDFSAQDSMPFYPGLPMSLEDIETQNTLFLVGSHINHEQPIAGYRVRKAALLGCSVFVLNPADYTFRFPVQDKCIVKPSAMPNVLAEVIKVLLEKGIEEPVAGLRELVNAVQPSEFAHTLAAALLTEGKKTIILGAIAQNHSHAGHIKQLADALAKMTHGHVAFLTAGANSAGAWIAGGIPHRGANKKNLTHPGMNTQQMLEARLSAYLLLNVEPGLDCANPLLANQAMSTAEFVVSISPYFCHKVASYSDVLLPSVPFSETAGTFVNAEGKWQSFKGAVQPQGEARPAWKIIRVLANLLELPEFDYQSCDEVYGELMQKVAENKADSHFSLSIPSYLPQTIVGIERLTEWPIYRADSLVRRAPSLQETVINDSPVARMSLDLANRLQLSADCHVIVKQGEGEAILPVELSDTIPDNTVYIPAGFGLTAELAAPFGAISIERSDS